MTQTTISTDHIVKFYSRYAEVRAAPGSGKTHNFILRAKYLLDTGVPAQNILGLSFSTATVREIRRRMLKLSNDLAASGSETIRPSSADSDLSKVTIQTVHAFSCGLIRTRLPDAVVLNDKSASAVLVKAIKSVRRDCEKGLLWPSPEISPEKRIRRLARLSELLIPLQTELVLNFLAVTRASKLKTFEALSMEQFHSLKPYSKVLPAVRVRFAAIKKEMGAIDYGDMLHQAGREIDAGASVPYTHILVDEYQDCSAAQIHLLAKLGKTDGRSIMVFGDPGQAIFGFGGGSYMPLSSVLDDVVELNLPFSRRLTAQNAALASAVARHTSDHVIQTDREGEQPVLICDNSLAAQTRHIVQDIQKLIANGVLPEQIAVLARIKALLAPVEQLLLARTMLTKRMGTTRNRRHALRVLRLVHVLERCSNADRIVKPEMLRRALPCLADVNDHLWTEASRTLKAVSRVPSLEGRYRLCSKIYLRLMGGIRADAELRADVNRWEPMCRSYYNAMKMIIAVHALEDRAVVTGTIHSAKGGEWNHVFVVGVTNGLLPLYLARDASSLSEERNLLYVAITRACKTVRLYHAPTNHARSRQRFKDVSRFLGAYPSYKHYVLHDDQESGGASCTVAVNDVKPLKTDHVKACQPGCRP